MTLSREALLNRKALGLAGDMQFTYRNPERSSDPKRIMSEARSIVAATFAYSNPTQARYSEATAPGVGVISRFARDNYYAQLRTSLAAVADCLRDRGYKAEVVVDSNALVDREVAWRAGLGWFGKNSMVLSHKDGSWILLGSVVTDAELPSTVDAPAADGCSSCTKCIDYCPTKAIIAPGVIDARRCIAWLVQSPSSIPIEYRPAVGTRLYGCDECQEVCPPSQIALGSSTPEDLDRSQVDLYWILSASNSDILANVDSWYIPKRDPDYVRRTALVNLGNSAVEEDERTWPTIERYLRSDNVLLRSHAVWAAKRLGFAERVAEVLKPEQLLEVEAEMEAAVELRSKSL